MQYQVKSHQGILEAALSSIFPTRNVTKNVRKKVSIRSPLTGSYLEVDVWYADLKLCFEYQDEYHYQPSWYSHIPLDVSKEMDEIKRTKLLQKGETLIEVPCWWDCTAESLHATIKFYRPDLLPLQQHVHYDIIPVNPPLQFFSDVSSSGDKQLMLASFLTSSEIEEMTGHNPWWLGEKYDGVRCSWNPEEGQLYSRSKQIIGVHAAVHKMFGHVALDGEIWCGRGHFNESLVLFSAPLDKVDWALFRIVCFDEASQSMREQPFEARYWFILSHYPPDHSVVIIASRFSCSSMTTLTNSLQQVIEGGGEGVILRRPHSLYQPGRSLDLVKFKGSQSDQEALVVDVEEDGSLLLQLPNGTTFGVAKADCELPRRAARGDVVTFTHDLSRRMGTQDLLAQDNTQTQWAQRGAQTRPTQEAVRGMPANIVVHRIRTDVIWEDVVNTSVQPVRQFHNKSYQKIDVTAKPISPRKFWDAVQNRRELLENFARSKGCDPLHPHFWYNLNPVELRSVKGATICSHHYAETIVHLFPELHMDISKLRQRTVQSWKKEANRRAFFDKFAASKGMDPRDPHFWSSVGMQELQRYQPGFSGILLHHGGRLSTCLMQLYPDIGLLQSQFETKQSWRTEADRRAFFDKYAASKGMDPRNRYFWSSVTVREIKRCQPGYEAIAIYHGRRLSTCLMQLYPDIGLTPSHFGIASQSKWDLKETRRSALLQFAKTRWFDPLVPANWYQFSWIHLSADRSTRSMLTCCYNKRYVTALMDLFPELNLQASDFVAMQSWKTEADRRAFFDKYAASKGMDPRNPDFWKSVTGKELRRFQPGFLEIVQYNKGRLSTCLIQLYPDIGLTQAHFRTGRKRRSRGLNQRRSHKLSHQPNKAIRPEGHPKHTYRKKQNKKQQLHKAKQ